MTLKASFPAQQIFTIIGPDAVRLELKAESSGPRAGRAGHGLYPQASFPAQEMFITIIGPDAVRLELKAESSGPGGTVGTVEG